MRLALISLLMIGTMLSSCGLGPRSQYLPEPIRFPTAGGFTEMMETWEGASSQELVESWGTPNSTFDIGNGTVVWAYGWDRSYHTPEYTVTKTGEGSATTTYNDFTDSFKTTYQPGNSTTTTYGGGSRPNFLQC